MIIRNVDRSKHPRLVAWMRDAKRTDPHLDVRAWVGHESEVVVVTRVDGVHVSDAEAAKVVALFETPPYFGDVNLSAPPPVAGRRGTCLDATHPAPCRCGAGYTKGPTLDEVAKLHEQMAVANVIVGPR